jgi:hypothetical protein
VLEGSEITLVRVQTNLTTRTVCDVQSQTF